MNSEKKLLKFKNQELRNENDLLVNKYGGSGNTNKVSVDCQTEMVGISYILVITIYSYTFLFS